MSGVYQTIENAIHCMAGKDEKAIKLYKELVTQYFEGVLSLDELPDTLKLAVAEWENEQEELER